MIGAGAVPDPSLFWWDLRPQPELRTAEVRVMDAQSTVADVSALVALIQSLWRLELERDSPQPLSALRLSRAAFTPFGR